jgi:nucleoside-diphosphate-sugar epimerase
MGAAPSHRFLVTGAAGFVGANLSRVLVASGETVHVLLRPGTRRWRVEEIEDRLNVHVADLTDGDAIDRLVDEVRPTVVYHLATHGAYHQQGDAERILRTNVLGLWNLLRACHRVGFELFVNTGSSSEYGRKRFAMREADMLDPDSFYAVAKSAQSLLCHHLGRESGAPIVTLRLFSVYGPYEEPGRLIPTLLMAAIHDKPIDMVSPATARDFVYVDDVVRTYLEIEKLKKLPGEILNLGSGVQSSLADVVAGVQELVEKPLHVHWGCEPPRPWDTDVWVADVSKVRRLIGFRPRVSLQEGLQRSLAWVREHESLYNH